MRKLFGKLTKKAIWMAAIVVALSAWAGAQQERMPRKVIVSIPDRKLVLVEAGQVLKTYAVAVGAPKSPSPEGDFRIVNRIENPTYYRPGTVIGPGPENPLGTRWIGLNEKGYGIHGTNAPQSIGKAASHGCIRMARKDLEEFFQMVRPGDTVEIRSKLDEQTAQLFEHFTDRSTLAMATSGDAQNRTSLGGGQ